MPNEWANIPLQLVKTSRKIYLKDIQLKVDFFPYGYTPEN